MTTDSKTDFVYKYETLIQEIETKIVSLERHTLTFLIDNSDYIECRDDVTYDLTLEIKDQIKILVLDNLRQRLIHLKQKLADVKKDK